MSRSPFSIAAAAFALLVVPSSALAAGGDRNGDGLSDRWEQRHHLSLELNQAGRDQDHDGLKNRAEFRHGTNPRRADTDRDGLNDGMEVRTGHNPRKRDSNGDGRPDGRDNAGTIQSLDGDMLTIKLADGSLLKGKVADTTRISCENNEIENEDVHNRRGRAARNEDDPGGPSSSGGGRDPNRPHDENEVENEHAAENEAGRDAEDRACSKADLTSGTAVRHAALDATSSGAVFEEVELVK